MTCDERPEMNAAAVALWLCLVLLLLPGTGWAAPTATIWTNRTDFKGGDQLVLSARVVGTGRIDLYLALVLPTGTTVYFDRLPLQPVAGISSVPVPILRAWPAVAVESPVLSYVFVGSEPAGRYVWEVLLVTPGGSVQHPEDVLSRHASEFRFRGADGSAVVPDDLGYSGNPQVKLDWHLGLRDLTPQDLEFDPVAYRVQSRVIHGTTVVVAIHESLAGASELQGFALPTPAEFTEFVFACFDRYWHVFDGFPYHRYTVKVTAPSDPRRFAVSPVGLIVAATDNPGIPNFPPHQYARALYQEFVAHELFHAWNGGVIQYEPAGDGRLFQLETWITEGATVYYSAWVLGTLLGPDTYRNTMQVRWEQYARNVGTPLDLSVEELTVRIGSPATVPPPDSELTTMLYARSSLLAYLLDLGLFEGGVSLDALMRYLYNHYGLVNRRWRQADLPPILLALTGRSFEAFFDPYLITNARLPLDGTFLFVDRDRQVLR